MGFWLTGFTLPRPARTRLAGSRDDPGPELAGARPRSGGVRHFGDVLRHIGDRGSFGVRVGGMALGPDRTRLAVPVFGVVFRLWRAPSPWAACGPVLWSGTG